MEWSSRLTSLYHRWMHGREVEQDLDGEVQQYFETMTERFMAQGLTPEEARRRARLRFEDPERVKQNVRDARLGASLETALQDIRYAARVLRKTPGFTIVAVLTLALGIGANTAIFSLIDTVMLRQLPVERPDRLVLLTDPRVAYIAVDTMEDGARKELAYPEFGDLRAGQHVFSSIFAAQGGWSDVDLLPDNAAEPVKARAQLVSGEYFQTLGVQPLLGRAFTPAEDRVPGASPVAVISYNFWQRKLGGNVAALGERIRVGGAIFEILGVVPPGFNGISVGSDTDVWFPISMQRQVLPGRDYLTPRDTLWLQVMGRLAPGVLPATAQAAVNVTFHQSVQAWAATLPSEQDRKQLLRQKLMLRPGARGVSALRGQFSEPLTMLMAMVGLVLLIACANIANLMLVRASGRQREIGVRLALGAARGRLVRQLLTESLLVAAAGGLVGLFFASAGARVLANMVLEGEHISGLDVQWNLPILLFTLVASLGTGLLFGVAPAIRATQLDVSDTLAANVRGSAGSRGRARTGRILAVTQVALSLVLLISAGRFVRSLGSLVGKDLGFDRAHLLAVRVDPAAAGYQPPARAELYARVRRGLEAIPGVRGVTFSNSGLFGGDAGDNISLDGSPIRNPEELNAQWTEIGPGYFRTLGIPLLQGREIDAADAAHGAQVCLVNQAFAKLYFPGASPIGRHVTDEYPTTRETYEIVGVAADAEEHGPERKKVYPRFYPNITHPIGSLGGVTFLLRSTGDPAALGGAAMRAIRQAVRDLPVLTLRTADAELGRRLVQQRILAELAAFFGAVALFMAGIGLYGVLSYSTARRTSEIGVRLALGASRAHVVRMVFGQTLRMLALGVAIGLPCALGVGRLIASRIYGFHTLDPWAMTPPLAILLGAALLAGYVPARRAARIDPVNSLRCE